MVDLLCQKQSVYIDSDAFIAMNNGDDALHQKAIAIYRKLSERRTHFCSSNYVFAEVVTVLSQRVSQQAAKDFISIIRAPECMFDLKCVSPETELSAINIFNQQRSKNVSFVDCVNIAIVKQYHLEAIFSFDGTYKQNGILTAKELVE